MAKITFTVRRNDGRDYHYTLQGKPAAGIVGLIHDYGIEEIKAGMPIEAMGITVQEYRR